MNQDLKKDPEPEKLDDYDFSGGVRGRSVGRFAKGSNMVVLDPDVARVFTDSESVNQALRALAEIIQHQKERIQSSNANLNDMTFSH